jgi:hypothetical protein
MIGFDTLYKRMTFQAYSMNTMQYFVWLTHQKKITASQQLNMLTSLHTPFIYRYEATHTPSQDANTISFATFTLQTYTAHSLYVHISLIATAMVYPSTLSRTYLKISSPLCAASLTLWSLLKKSKMKGDNTFSSQLVPS